MDLFARFNEDMPDIDLLVIIHRLNVDPTYKSAEGSIVSDISE